MPIDSSAPICHFRPDRDRRLPNITKTVLSANEDVSAPIAGREGRFPVRRDGCIGRNYAAHAVEMGQDPNRKPPFFLQKNPDDLASSGEFPYPEKTSDELREIELVVPLGRVGRIITVDAALDCVWGHAVGLDVTRRDLQGEAKKISHPWEVGKAFERSAPMGPIVPARQTGYLAAGSI